MNRRIAFAIVATLGAGCLTTPSIPIPPPSPELMTFHIELAGTSHTAAFSYPATPAYSDAVVFIYDKSQGAGVIATARADGSVGPTEPFTAAIGDNVDVSFQIGETESSSCIVLRDGSQSSTSYCN